MTYYVLRRPAGYVTWDGANRAYAHTRDPYKALTFRSIIGAQEAGLSCMAQDGSKDRGEIIDAREAERI